jgi:hypothetical protein
MRTIILVASILFGSLTLFAPQANAQGGLPLWTNFYNGPGNNQDQATAVAVNNNGNVFVTGSSVGTGGSQDYATVAYSSAGLALWTNSYRGSGFKTAIPAALAADTNGNVFVTGQAFDGTNYNAATINYSTTGAPLWTNLYIGPTNARDGGNALAVDSHGDVLVAGYYSYNGTSYYLALKYSNAGTPVWTNLYNGGVGDSVAYAVALDNSGNVFVTGRSSGIGTGDDYATVAYSGTGLPLWTNRYNGPGNTTDDDAYYIAVDNSGNVIVTGSSIGLGTGADYATIKYSNAGVPLWTNRYDGPAQSDDFPAGIAVDSSGNVFVTGYSTATNGYLDYATVAYSGTGVPLWTNRYDGAAQGDDSAVGIAVDSSGNVFVTGSSTAASGYKDYATVAYSGTGVPLFTNLYAAAPNGDALASAIAVDGSGNLLVTGYSSNGSTNEFVTIKYSSSAPSAPVRLDFQRLNNQLVLSWTNASFALQSAPTVTATFTNIPGATSPYTNSLTGPQQYFRLRSN